MQLSKKQEAELLKVYETWWKSYLNGDVKTYDSFLDDSYHFVGSTNGEEYLNRKDTTGFFKATADQLAGKAELRNLKRTIEKLEGGLILITDVADAWVISEPEWVFYSRFRFTSLMKETKSGWRFIYQHFSAPDTKAQEGETLGTEQITKENQELRDALKRRTVELEHKTRELEIEASLERVRSVAMSMRKPEELAAVSEIIFSELKTLGFTELRNTEIIINNHDKESIYSYYYSDYGVTGTIEVFYKTHPTLIKWVAELKKASNAFSAVEITEKEMAGWIKYREEIGYLPDPKLNTAKTINYYSYSTGLGALSISTFVPVLPDQVKILEQFRNVFELAYRRYVDVALAEAQAREAQIELGLERVRARAMAMQHSNELSDLVDTVFKELTKLDFAISMCIINIIEENNFSNMVWAAHPDTGKPPESYFMKFEDYPFHHAMMKGYKARAAKFIYVIEGEEKKIYDDYLFSKTEFSKMPLEAQAASKALEKYVSSFSFSNFGGLQTVGDKPLSDTNLDILARFGKVFDLTYTRFNDLQKAEAQAREAQIEAALERVRSRTMGMQHSAELGDVAAELFVQMNLLVTNLWTCGFVLCEKNRNDDEWWLSMDTGFTRGFLLPNIGDFAHATLYEGWVKGDAFRAVQLEGEALQQHYDWLMNLPVARSIFEEMEKAGLERPDWQKLHAAYFSKGYLVLITREPCNEEEIFKRFAQVFDQTYTRFLDLQKAEQLAKQAQADLENLIAAKKKTEEALTELKATQSQLIQSEKMASLGELTAGIAHEIQNPLNFVNNFSEVSKEMLDEMREAIEKGDTDEAKKIMSDVIQNLEKINLHGKRADGIVKGMLQHSRSSSGVKEPTDINALADEYLRLAFHGLRAKDKSFNATLKTEFDKTIGNINIIPQDIGRVMLNLINNAFYVVDERKKQIGGGYEPIVSVSTKKMGDKVLISVTDNGSGIPQKVLDKIFQPFFTTKPTGQGTGLGLSLSYDIVKAHDGELKVDTKEGEGTKFIIQLPIYTKNG